MKESTIKFDYAASGEIDLYAGDSPIMFLFALGALQATRGCSVKDNNGYRNYATDRQGLEKLVERSEDVLENLHDSLQALSLVMTETENVQVKNNIGCLSWLIVGLTELAATVAHNNSDMHYILRSAASEWKNN